jgi:OOP family OmpA-OmpF porin
MATVTGRIYDGRNLKPVNDAEVLVRKSNNDSLVAQTKTVDGIYNFELTPYESYRISAQADGFQSKSVSIRTTNRFEEVKSSLVCLPKVTRRPYRHCILRKARRYLKMQQCRAWTRLLLIFKSGTILKLS